MNEALLLSLLGLTGGGFISLLCAIATGMFVTRGKYGDMVAARDAAAASREALSQAYETLLKAHTVLTEENKRAAELTQITNAVLAAMKASTQPGGA